MKKCCFLFALAAATILAGVANAESDFSQGRDRGGALIPGDYPLSGGCNQVSLTAAFGLVSLTLPPSTTDVLVNPDKTQDIYVKNGPGSATCPSGTITNGTACQELSPITPWIDVTKNVSGTVITSTSLALTASGIIIINYCPYNRNATPN